MRGILKSSHEKLCNCLEDIKASEHLQDNKLNELEVELLSAFKNYQQKMNDLKRLVHIYEEKQRAIKNEMKKIRKYSISDSKKLINHAFAKVERLVIIAIQNILIYSISDVDFTNYF